MSYDYDALVADITESRKLVRETRSRIAGSSSSSSSSRSDHHQLDTTTDTGDNNNNNNYDNDDEAQKLLLVKHLTMCVDGFETLSGHCPMTPLLWMQYALDASDLLEAVSEEEEDDNDNDQNQNQNETTGNNEKNHQNNKPKNSTQTIKKLVTTTVAVAPREEFIRTRLQLLELGLHEFPGSAILRLHYADLLRVLVVVLERKQQQQQQQQQKQQQKQKQSRAEDADPIVDVETVRTAIRNYKQALDEAIRVVGDGSHRNESKLVVEFFRQRCAIEARNRVTVTGPPGSHSNSNSYLDSELGSSAHPHAHAHAHTVVADVFLRRASVPFADGVNAGLGEEYARFCDTHLKGKGTSMSTSMSTSTNTGTGTGTGTPPDPSTIIARIETYRRWESKDYGWSGTYEDDIDVALWNESGVSNRDGIELLEEARREAVEAQADNKAGDNDNDNNDKESVAILRAWNRVLNNNEDSNTTTTATATAACWMGLGGSMAARAYVKYARACLARVPKNADASAGAVGDSNKNESDDDDDGDDDTKQRETELGTRLQGMSVSVYERGVAECPTVEYLWLSYLRHLTERIETIEHDLRDATNAAATTTTETTTTTTAGLREERAKMLNGAASVVDRAIKNCPYSTELVTIQLGLILQRVNAGMLVLDPEDLMTNLVIRRTLGNGFIEPEPEQTTGEGTSANTDPGAAVQLFRALLDVVRKRILFLLAEMARTEVTSTSTSTSAKKNKKKQKTTTVTILRYDDPESIQPILSPNNHNNNRNRGDDDDERDPRTRLTDDDDLLQELEDLCIDFREICDEADSYLRTRRTQQQQQYYYSNQSAVDEGRALLANERALSESRLVAPLLRAIENVRRAGTEDGDANADADSANTKAARERLAEVARHYDRAVKMVQPPHPGTYRSYIRAVSDAASSVVSVLVVSPIDVLTNLRRLRFLYQRGLRAVGKPRLNERTKNAPPKNNDPPQLDLDLDFDLDYETSLRCLCHDYLIFEQMFGSARSYQDCVASVQKKLTKTTIAATVVGASASRNASRNAGASRDTSSAMPMDLDDHAETDNTNTDGNAASEASNQAKRKREEDNRSSSGEADAWGGSGDQRLAPPNKKPKEEGTDNRNEQETHGGAATTTNTTTHPKQQQQQQQQHKIRVGKLEYPAHPFTVRVSFLSPATEDMDLVDALRPRCGAIVHAKIMREKDKGNSKDKAHRHHQSGGRKSNNNKSKGWGLVQFEERESVEKALALSDVIGIQQKSVRIERSHLPAVGLVPPGMHRVNPKGEGRSTKRNLLLRNKRNEQQQQHQQQQRDAPKPAAVAVAAGSSPGESTAVTAAQTKHSSSIEEPEASAVTTSGKRERSGTSVLAFRPRGVAASKASRKAKINVSSKEGGTGD